MPQARCLPSPDQLGGLGGGVIQTEDRKARGEGPQRLCLFGWRGGEAEIAPPKTVGVVPKCGHFVGNWTRALLPRKLTGPGVCGCTWKSLDAWDPPRTPPALGAPPAPSWGPVQLGELEAGDLSTRRSWLQAPSSQDAPSSRSPGLCPVASPGSLQDVDSAWFIGGAQVQC